VNTNTTAILQLPAEVPKTPELLVILTVALSGVTAHIFLEILLLIPGPCTICGEDE